MMGEIRVTVIATGFDRDLQGGLGPGPSRATETRPRLPGTVGHNPARTGTGVGFASQRAVPISAAIQRKPGPSVPSQETASSETCGTALLVLLGREPTSRPERTPAVGPVVIQQRAR
jgi:hypothetical protein